MAEVRKVQITVTGDTTDLDTKLDAVETKGAEVSESVNASLDQVPGRIGQVATGFKSAVGGVKKFVLGLKTVKAAVIATGVGALVVAITALVTYFTKSQRGAEKLEIATKAFGAVVGVVTDKAIAVGEAIVEAFSKPKETLTNFANLIKTFVMDKVDAVSRIFGLLGETISNVFAGEFKAALGSAAKAAKVYATEVSLTGQIITAVAENADTLAESFNDVVDQVSSAIDKGAQLARESIALRKAQRDLRVEMAEGRAEIKEYNKIAEDTTQTLEDRIAAAEHAIEIEQGLMDERVKNAAKELELHNRDMALSESTEEDFERQADLEAALAQVRMESYEMQTTLQNKLNTIRTQAMAEAEAAAKAEQDALQAQYDAILKMDTALASAQEKEVMTVAIKYDELLALAEQYGYDEQELIDQQNAEVAAINEKYRKQKADADEAQRKKDLAAERLVQTSKLQMAGAALGALTALNTAFAKDGEEQSKSNFNRNKALGIGVASINTALAISDALAKDATFPGSRFIAAASAGLLGVAQVATIKKQKYGSQAGGATPSIGLPSQGSSSIGNTGIPALDVGFLGEGSGATLNQSYVVSQQVSTQQQANQLIGDQAALYG